MSVRRLVPLFAAVLAAGLLATGSLALARSDNGTEAKSGAGDGGRGTCDHNCRGQRHSAWDEQWLMMSIEGDRFEIRGGRLAQQKATTDQVRALGARLVRDHSESLATSVKLAHRLGIEVPGSPSPTQEWELRAVAQFSGRAFDRWYSDLEVQDHIQDIDEAQNEVDKGCNQDVRKDAREEIPVLREHLQLARQALASVR
jgi:putative membrane protein